MEDFPGRRQGVSAVLDSSATVAWLHGDERTPAIEAVFDRVAEQGALVPSLWYLEVANSLTVAVRRGRISSTERADALADLAQLDIAVDDETEQHAWKATTQLADLHGLSVYDAAYLELAQRKRLPLVTLDKALRRAAQVAGIEVLV
jgi:predicted nucleic acid-binding protein